MQVNSPQNIDDLKIRSDALIGQTIAHLATQLNLNIPNNLLHAKGWIGQLLEKFLGATAASKALPDFAELGIELKTIPVSRSLKPLESTYVCTVQTNQYARHWRDSWVYNKLRHVLWIPIVSEPELAIHERFFVQPIFWQMDAATEEILRTDWEELMEMLQLGFGKSLSAKFGTYLHIRPKAANNSVLQDYLDEQGQQTKIVPKGFYLRPSFTAGILNTQKFR